MFVIYEFGYGLSYIIFEYSNIQVIKKNVGFYKLMIGQIVFVLIFGNFLMDFSDYLFFDEEFFYVYQYIYFYFNIIDLRNVFGDLYFGQMVEEFMFLYVIDDLFQLLLLFLGKNFFGGNWVLYDILYEVMVDIINMGEIVGDEVVQLYVFFGGFDDFKVVLCDFGKFRIELGQMVKFRGLLMRRDLSNWDVVSQDWVISEYIKMVFVGKSSRDLGLSVVLE